jgi:type IV pilus assembly protein PilO
MRRDFTTRRRVILGFVTILLLADVALAAYSWDLVTSPRTPQKDFERQALQLKMLQADISRAQKIKNDMPNIQKDCEKFEKSLLAASSGSSSLSSELDNVAKKSGVRLEDLTFKPTAIPERGMTEVAIDSTITGDYKSVILFLNGLQRSNNNYIVESLTLANDNSNQGPASVIKVGLHLKTYLRTTA